MFYELTDRFVVDADLNRTWDFFSRAENLPRITPPWMNFRVATPGPIEIRQNSIIDYQIRWMNLPLRWRTRIIDWSPPRQFIDLQLRGPYTLWHHQHTFEAAADGGTLCTDRVIYKVPVPGVGRLMNALVIKRQLLGIFRYRQTIIAQELGLKQSIEEPSIQSI